MTPHVVHGAQFTTAVHTAGKHVVMHVVNGVHVVVGIHVVVGPHTVVV